MNFQRNSFKRELSYGWRGIISFDLSAPDTDRYEQNLCRFVANLCVCVGVWVYVCGVCVCVDVCVCGCVCA